ncbi:DUF3040 domain-containing protein [Amycolatopsis lurida]
MNDTAPDDDGGLLSDRERRELELIEQHLLDDDPDFARTLDPDTAGLAVIVWTAMTIFLGATAVLGVLAGDAILLLAGSVCGATAYAIRSYYHRKAR